MGNKGFTHLHVHTEASLIDGLGTVDNLVREANNRGFKRLAITDHGTLANTISFSRMCESEGIIPIIGLEGYIAVDGEIGHITLLADGERGFNNLVGLNNLAHISEYRKPAFTPEQLVNHSDGLILLTGCINSPLHKLSEKEAIRLGAYFKSYFEDRMYGESMFVGENDEMIVRTAKLSEALNLPIVLTNDVHFTTRELSEIHPILTQLKAAFNYGSSHLWLKTIDELLKMGSNFLPQSRIIQYIENTAKLSELIVPPSFKRKESLPEVDDAFETLVFESFEGLKNLYLDGSKEYIDRLNFELDLIWKFDYASYFLILKDIVGEAKRRGIRVGAGRGSGGGSLILFLLGITTINPIEHSLSFERFLNPLRKGMPDVDVDFESERRDEVLSYAAEKYEAYPISSYVRYSHVTLVKDLGRMFKLDRDLTNKAADLGDESKPFKQLCEEVPIFKKAYYAMIGQIKNKGTHAGGVVITDLQVPLERTKDGGLASSWSEGLARHDLSYAGVVKFDLLGVSTLSVLSRLEKKYGFQAPKPTPNDEVFSLFREGRLTGIFQFTSSGMRELTLKLKPTSFDDLVALTALYRPGSLDAGTAENYPEWKKNPRKIHPAIDKILEETYGVIVYQEQVMEVYKTVTGGDLGTADLARRTLTKLGQEQDKNPAFKIELQKMNDEFMGKGLANGFDESLLEMLWGELATHSRYSFNKAHATAYTYITWECAWWKFHYPLDFYTESLNIDSANTQKYLYALANDGFSVVAPHINISSAEWVNDGEKIYMPLHSVKYLGEKGSEEIIQERESKGEFSSYKDVIKRCSGRSFNKRARRGLFYLGGLKGLEGSIDDLSIDEKEFLHPYLAQKQFLGMVLPDKALLKTFNSNRKKGFLSGVVHKKHKRRGTFGPYIVYYLVPNGVFWISGDKDILEAGDIVKVEYDNRNGKGKKVNIFGA